MELKERNQLIVQDYLSGMRFKDVCKKYHVGNICRILERYGVDVRGKASENRLAKQQRNELIIQDYQLGLTKKQICEKYDMRCIDAVIKNSGIKFNKKSGRKPKYSKIEDIPESNTSEIDRLWIDKQIVALTKQGLGIPEIMRRYNVNTLRIAKVRREAGLTMLNKTHIMRDERGYDGYRIPEMETALTIRPQAYREHFSQVIWR